MMICYMFTFMLFFISLYYFCLLLKNLLVMLVMIEFIMLSLYINLFMIYLIYGIDSLYLFLYYFSFIVCESVMGLTLLVLIIRMYGNDYVLSGVSVMW